MTCLAYKDGVLAADSQTLDVWTPAGSCPKIAKRGRLLAGGAGEAAYVKVFLDWFKSEEFDEWLASNGKLDYPQLGRPEKDRETNGFIILPDDSCLRFESGAPPYRLTGPFFAWGSGNWVAVGAMAAGASADEAIRIAHQWDAGTGPLSTVLRRDDADDGPYWSLLGSHPELLPRG